MGEPGELLHVRSARLFVGACVYDGQLLNTGPAREQWRLTVGARYLPDTGHLNVVAVAPEAQPQLVLVGREQALQAYGETFCRLGHAGSSPHGVITVSSLSSGFVH